MTTRKKMPLLVASFILLLFLAALIGCGALLWWLGSQLGLGPTAIGSAVLAAIGFLIKTSIDRTRAHERLLAESKRQQYFEFLEYLTQFMPNDDDGAAGEPERGKERVEELRLWSFKLMMIGSDAVLRAWTRARLHQPKPAENEHAQSAMLMRRWGELLREMRRDCGHHRTKLRTSEILSTFVNDIDSYADLIDRRR